MSNHNSCTSTQHIKKLSNGPETVKIGKSCQLTAISLQLTVYSWRLLIEKMRIVKHSVYSLQLTASDCDPKIVAITNLQGNEQPKTHKARQDGTHKL